MSIWYYYQNEEKLGPVEPEQLWSLFQAGQVTSNTQLWCQGMTQWLPMLQVQGFSDPTKQGQLAHVMSQPASYPALSQRLIKQACRSFTQADFAQMITGGLMHVPIIAVLPMSSLYFRDGSEISDKIYLFRRPGDLLLVWKTEQVIRHAQLLSPEMILESEDDVFALMINCSRDQIMASAAYRMSDPKDWQGGTGQWRDLWQSVILKHMGLSQHQAHDVQWGAYRVWTFASQYFGGLVFESERSFLGTVDSNHQLFTWPELPFNINEMIKSASWWVSSQDCFLVQQNQSGPRVIQLSWHPENEGLTQSLIQAMDPSMQLHDPREFHQGTGCFLVENTANASHEYRLLRSCDGVVEYWENISTLVHPYQKVIYQDDAFLLCGEAEPLYLQVEHDHSQGLLIQMPSPG